MDAHIRDLHEKFSEMDLEPEKVNCMFEKRLIQKFGDKFGISDVTTPEAGHIIRPEIEKVYENIGLEGRKFGEFCEHLPNDWEEEWNDDMIAEIDEFITNELKINENLKIERNTAEQAEKKEKENLKNKF